MPTVLSRRGPLAAVIVLVLALVAAFAASSLRTAQAQEPFIVTDVFSNLDVTAVNGFVFIEDAGTDDGVFGIACTGAAPLGGSPNLPVGVITNLQATQTALRIAGPNLRAVTGDVQINCVVTYEIAEQLSVSERAKRFQQRVSG